MVERGALVSVTFVSSLIALLRREVGATLMGKVALQNTFGSILTVHIWFEFSHSISVALTQRTGIQFRILAPRSRSTWAIPGASSPRNTFCST
jgi:hypothetical protein